MVRCLRVAVSIVKWSCSNCGVFYVAKMLFFEDVMFLIRNKFFENSEYVKN